MNPGYSADDRSEPLGLILKILSETRGPLLTDLSVKELSDRIEVSRDQGRLVIIPSAIVAKHPGLCKKLVLQNVGVLLIGPVSENVAKEIQTLSCLYILNPPIDPHCLFSAIHTLLSHVCLAQVTSADTQLLARYRYELGEMIEIARAITQERSIDTLLGLILEKARYITSADAGSIYVLENKKEDATEPKLHFKLSQNDSVDFKSEEYVMPVSKRSIVGTAVLMRQPINIPDVYHPSSSATYEFDSRFDQRSGYRTRSVIAVPLISAKDEVIGVIQLINRKRNPNKPLKLTQDFEEDIIPFDERSQELLTTLSAQAGIALENALLYEEIQQIFEGFVRASVSAIEQRDPCTSGHSVRVSNLSLALARAVCQVNQGRFKDVHFGPQRLKELEYACLLHDFGKIGVREKVLLKAKKLYPHQLDKIGMRIDLSIHAAKIEALNRKLSILQKTGHCQDFEQLEKELGQQISKLQRFWKLIKTANEPSAQESASLDSLMSEVKGFTYTDREGKRQPLLDTEELNALNVTRGSLTSEEFNEIRSHVDHSYNFLVQIPWGKSMKQIPEIAHAHHERIDGSGYPQGKQADQIPLSSRIISIADIYDALTASDRLYKKAIPQKKALEIISKEAKLGYLDPDLVKLFIQEEIYNS